MGTYAGYTGGMDIAEEERDDFTEKMLKLLNYGGMMNFEVINMFLKDIDNKYHRIFAFVEMFYEFINHSNQPEYQAAIELLKVLAEENEEVGRLPENAERCWSILESEHVHNIGRLRIKRYLSLLANKQLRKKYLEF